MKYLLYFYIAWKLFDNIWYACTKVGATGERPKAMAVSLFLLIIADIAAAYIIYIL